MLRNGDDLATSPLILIHPGNYDFYFEKIILKTVKTLQKYSSGQSREQQNGRICGTQRPARFNTTSNVMSVQFHSDGSGTGKGEF